MSWCMAPGKTCRRLPPRSVQHYSHSPAPLTRMSSRRECVTPKARRIPGTSGTRPGDLLNATADRAWWSDLLETHNWTLVHQHDDIDYWRRPGKEEEAWSATLGACGPYFYVFSSNAAPFEQGKAYSAFSALTLLKHSGDFKAAAKALAPPRQQPKQPARVIVGLWDAGATGACLPPIFS